MTDAKPKSKAVAIRAARIAPFRARRRPAPKGLLGRLGPGLITGASDDDPSGIATYSQAGAQFGYAMCWVMLFCFPLMAAIQEISARIGRVTGQGIAGNIRAHYSPWLLRAIIGLLLGANIINLGADLGAMAAALQLLVGGPIGLYVIGFAVGSALLEVFVSYERYVSILKWTSFVLLAYVAVAATFVGRNSARGLPFSSISPMSRFLFVGAVRQIGPKRGMTAVWPPPSAHSLIGATIR